jgi:hypothetical protein
LSSASPAANQNGRRRSITLSQLPTSGPMMKPTPNAAPIMP